LCRIVVAQQLSTASAGAIWNRLEQAFPSVSPMDILDAEDAVLRRIGLSGGKIRTLRAAARAVADGLDLEALDASSDDEIRSALCAISGIGPWTADIYVMFCLGRADAFAAGDLALQIAAQHAFGREGRPSPAELLDLAEAWRPWRGVAARVLWAWYPNIRRTKQPEPV
jgi:DNA-3-methyladenine glycosylase II